MFLTICFSNEIDTMVNFDTVVIKLELGKRWIGYYNDENYDVENLNLIWIAIKKITRFGTGETQASSGTGPSTSG